MTKKHCINTLFYDLDQASRICRLFGEQNFKNSCEYDLVFDEFIILDTVTLNPDICQRDLANILLKGKSHVSKILAQLSDKGYIERPVDTEKNRVVRRIIITDKGNEVYLKTEAQMKKILKVIEKTVDKDEVEHCRKFLQNIKKAIESTNYVKLD